MSDMDVKSVHGDMNWSMKVVEKTPKHFIKYIGRCIRAKAEAEPEGDKNDVGVESLEPTEQLRVHREKRFQLGAADRLAALGFEPPKPRFEKENTHAVELEGECPSLSSESKKSLKSDASRELTECNSKLSSDLSRSVVGLMHRALAAPGLRAEVLSELAGSEGDLTGLDLSPLEKLRLQRARAARAPEEVFGPRDKMAPELFVQKTIEQNGVVIFASSKCPFCARLQYILEMHEKAYTMLRLDKMGVYGKQVFKYLCDNWVELNVPNVYLHGKHFDMKLMDDKLLSMTKDVTSLDPSIYDLMVIGGGPEGCAAAINAAEQKRKVCLIDCIDVSRDRPFWVLGKTGLNVGSVPKRYLFQAALDCIDFHDSKYYGWEEETFCLKWSSLVRDIWKELKRSNWEYRVSLRKAGVTYLNCETVLVDRHTVEVYKQDMKSFRLKFRYMVLTLGVHAYIPKIPGCECCITSDEIFLQHRVPGRVLIFGGSCVAVEYAFILRQLGFPVTLMVPGTIMRNIDKEIVDEIIKRFAILGIELVRECLIIRVEPIKKQEDPEKDNNGVANPWTTLLKDQLVDYSEDYIRLCKSDIQSEIAKDSGGVTSELSKPDEVHEDGVKLKKHSAKVGSRNDPTLPKRISKSTKRNKLSRSPNTLVSGGNLADDGPNQGWVSKTGHLTDSIEIDLRKSNEKGNRQLRKKLKCRKSEIKQKSIFSTYSDTCLKENAVNKQKSKTISGEHESRSTYEKEEYTDIPNTLCDDNLTQTDGTKIPQNVKGIRISNEDSDCLRNTFDGPKSKGNKGKGKAIKGKGKGLKGKGKGKLKGKKGKGKKAKTPPLPKETDSEKALREDNEKLLRLLTKVITTKNLRGPGSRAKEPTFDGQPSFSVTGLFGNGTLHRGVYNTVVIAAGDETTCGSLALNKVGININPGTGKIYTNKNDQTTLENVYAIGDAVEGKSYGTSAAVCAATYLVQRLFTSGNRRMNYSVCSDLLFVPPSEYSFAGLSEERARQTFTGQINVYKKWFRPIDTIFSHRNTTRSFIKVICHAERKEREKVIGLHIFGRNAGYTVQGFTLAMRKGLYVHDLESLIATDLTNAEKLTDIESRPEERREDCLAARQAEARRGWDEELRELQEVPSAGDLPPTPGEGEEPPSEILIALERSASQVLEEEAQVGEPASVKQRVDSTVRFHLSSSSSKRLTVIPSLNRISWQLGLADRNE